MSFTVCSIIVNNAIDFSMNGDLGYCNFLIRYIVFLCFLELFVSDLSVRQISNN